MPKFKVWITQYATVVVEAEVGDDARIKAKKAYIDHDPNIEYFEPSFESAVKIVEREAPPSRLRPGR